jgi:chemotaxis protein methyltransferase CheR
MNRATDADTIATGLLVEAIHLRYGYDLRNYAPAFLERRIAAALTRYRLPHLGELQHRVLTDADFFDEFLESLIVRVTEMFRDPQFFAAFRTKVTPFLRTYPLLKVWHCGCASGEEVYASAILLKEEGLYDRCQIYATDLSARALEQAAAGVYPASHVDDFRRGYEQSGGTSDFARYYTEGYGGIAMRESLRRNVLFFQHNLVSDHVFGEMHVIFCRNVLIYFDASLKHRVLTKFRGSLTPQGLLCLGSSERLAASDAALGWTEFDVDARIYRHQPNSAADPGDER